MGLVPLCVGLFIAAGDTAFLIIRDCARVVGKTELWCRARNHRRRSPTSAQGGMCADDGNCRVD